MLVQVLVKWFIDTHSSILTPYPLCSYFGRGPSRLAKVLKNLATLEAKDDSDDCKGATICSYDKSRTCRVQPLNAKSLNSIAAIHHVRFKCCVEIGAMSVDGECVR